MTEQTEQTEQQTFPFKFTGNGSEYFKIWIVNLILTILTLGIYSAWAKVRNKRYFYGNTTLDNAAFEYHATPMMILKGRLIAITALIIYALLSEFFPIVGIAFAVILTVFIPWAVWRSIQFNARMVSYRNVRFSFYGILKDAYKILLLIPFLPVIIGAVIASLVYFIWGEEGIGMLATILGITMFVFYLMFPYVQKLLTSYYINNRQFGQGKFSAQLSAKKYYFIYLYLILATSLFIITLSIVVTVISIITGGFGNIGTMDDSQIPGLIMGGIFLMYISFIIIGTWGTAYLEAKVKNYVFSSVQLDETLQFQSNIQVGKLFVIYITNILLIMFTLGLAYPWTVVRLKKYKIESTSAVGNITEYVNQQQENQSALGEELGDAFDTELDLGI
ncbi:YjgN family protein [Candidatus Halobeggiatoa sp. HSG11]|nr:YjgN family protein [Candidatus Halobeggiatoa sp. HSG11]